MYDKALIYDIAFSYRDYAREAAVIAGWHERVAGRAPRSVLELAGGPAGHARVFARWGLRAAALDLAPEMCAYAAAVAQSDGLPVAVMEGDMTSFAVDEPFDLAILMINSIAHVHTYARLVAHLRSVRAALRPGGVYVVEMQHPGDFLGRGARRQGVGEPWTVERDGVRVTTRWGSLDDRYDPIAQVFHATVEARVMAPDGESFLRDAVPMRDWTPTELEAAALAAGLVLREYHGDLALDAPFDTSDASWRCVAVLQRPDPRTS